MIETGVHESSSLVAEVDGYAETPTNDTYRDPPASVFEDDAGLNPYSAELNEPIVETDVDESSGQVAGFDNAELRNTSVDGEATGNPEVDSEELGNSIFESSGSSVQSLPSVSQGVEVINTCDQFALLDVAEMPGTIEVLMPTEVPARNTHSMTTRSKL
ncbi:hypothetical protein V6N13_148927 [Hibiscus sabdariffa]